MSLFFNLIAIYVFKAYNKYSETFIGLQPVLSLVSVPFPPTPLDPLTRTLLASLCETELSQETICRLLENSMFGYSGDQQLIIIKLLLLLLDKLMIHKQIE